MLATEAVTQLSPRLSLRGRLYLFSGAILILFAINVGTSLWGSFARNESSIAYQEAVTSAQLTAELEQNLQNKRQQVLVLATLRETTEEPLDAALREVREETSIDDVDFEWGDRFTETGPYSRGKTARSCDVGRERLLHQHMDTRLGGAQADLEVRARRDGHADTIDALEQVFKAGGGLAARLCSNPARERRIHVVNARKFDRRAGGRTAGRIFRGMQTTEMPHTDDACSKSRRFTHRARSASASPA